MSLKHSLSPTQFWSVYAVFPLPLSTKAGSLTRFTVRKKKKRERRSKCSAAHHAAGEASTTSTTLQYNPAPDSLLRGDSWPRKNFLLSDQKQKAKDHETSHQTCLTLPRGKAQCVHLGVRSQNRLFLQTDSSVHTGSDGTNSLGVSGLETVMSPQALPLFPKRPFTPRRTLVPFREAWPLPGRPRMGGQLLSCQRQC